MPESTFKLSDYGLPAKEESILLMTETELLAITDILRELAINGVHHRPQQDILKKIEDLEKPFKKQNLNIASDK